MRDFKAACEALEQAAECYGLAGKIDSSCRVWLKIADIYENQLNNYLQASDAFKKCIDLYQISDKNHSIADVLKSYIAFMARHLSTESAFSPLLIEYLDQQINLQAQLKQVRQNKIGVAVQFGRMITP